MSEQPKDLETSYINRAKVFREEDGSIYFWKTITVEKWNDYLKKYVKHQELDRKEKVTPEQLQYFRSGSDKILVVKKIQSEDTLTDSEVVFEMELTFAFKNEELYRYQYFYRCRSGRIMVCDFASGCTFSAGVNDAQYVTRGKTKKLPENTLIPRNKDIYTLNSNGELELRLREPTEER